MKEDHSNYSKISINRLTRATMKTVCHLNQVRTLITLKTLMTITKATNRERWVRINTSRNIMLELMHQLHTLLIQVSIQVGHKAFYKTLKKIV